MQAEKEFESALNPTVKKLGLVSFFADVASEMLYPVTPIFLTTVLGASMSYLGLIEGIAEAAASLLKTYSGSWSDSIARRKPFIIVGYFLGAISKPFIGLSNSWTQVLAARVLDRTGKGIRSAPRDALIVDSVAPSKRGAALGWHRGMDTLGAAVGPLFAILLLSLNPSDLRSLYYWALIPGLISVIVIFTIRESKPEVHPKPFENPFKTWDKCGSDFKKYIFAWGVFSVANSSDVFLLMKAKSVGLSTQSVILLFCLYNLIYALSSPYLGNLSDRIDRMQVLVGGLAIFALVYLGFGFANANWQFWLLFAIYGIYMGATDGVGKALAVDLAPKEFKATGIGILGTVTGICTIAASVLAGLIWDHFGSTWTFIFAALGSASTIAILLYLIRSKTQPREGSYNAPVA
jgi:MFS family permease